MPFVNISRELALKIVPPLLGKAIMPHQHHQRSQAEILTTVSSTYLKGRWCGTSSYNKSKYAIIVAQPGVHRFSSADEYGLEQSESSKRLKHHLNMVDMSKSQGRTSSESQSDWYSICDSWYSPDSK